MTPTRSESTSSGAPAFGTRLASRSRASGRTAPSPAGRIVAGVVVALALVAATLFALRFLGSTPFDLVIVNGRVMDPETGLDGLRNVAIRGGTIAAVTEESVAGRDTIDAMGFVVAPGFVDLHAHGQDSISEQLQALDGVTTALEMEVGVHPVGPWYASREGRALINYGATVSHPNARAKLLSGVDVGHQPTLPPGANEAMGSDVIYEALEEAQVAELAALMETGLEEGGLGYGFGIAYTPGASRAEILDLFESAAVQGVPAYVHLRGDDGGGVLGPFQEVIANAAATGAALHIVHLNSSAGESARDALALIRGARERGVDVTTEAYPYTASATFIESALFDSWEGLDDAAYARLQWPGQAERLDRERFSRYREQGGWVVIHGRNEATNEWIVAQPDVIAASDGIPFLHVAAHPRGAGTFARILGRYSRDRGAIGLMDALAKMTILPARRVQGAAPAMARKGRVQEGADADLAIFDPATVLDLADYDAPATPSRGFVHVLVRGTSVVRDGRLVEGVWPGEGIRRGG